MEYLSDDNVEDDNYEVINEDNTGDNNGGNDGRAEEDEENDLPMDLEAAREYDMEDEPDAEADGDDESEERGGDAAAAAAVQQHRKSEPSYAAANQMPFYWLCARMEKIWQLKLNKKKQQQQHVSDEEKLKCLLPPHELQRFEQLRQPPQSLFPVLRLIMSEKDSSRSFNMKENLLAKAYAEAFQLVTEQHDDYRKLVHFTDPIAVGSDRAGDFSRVLEGVLQHRIASVSGSRFTVGDVNDLLDELVSLPKKASIGKRTNHDWRSNNNNSTTNPPAPKRQRKGPTLKELRAEWVRRLNCPHHNHHHQKGELSPLEHKWLVRIVLGKLQLGMGWTRMFNWYHPSATAIWSSHNSLKGVCKVLCDSNLLTMRENNSIINNNNNNNNNNPRKQLRPSRESYMPRTKEPVQLGVPFEPMLSERTSFQRALTNLSWRHREFLAAASQQQQQGIIIQELLAVQHPVFSVETKLDGERMLIHMSRDGIVKIHSRRAKWHSQLYTPVLGPALRRAVGKHSNMDIILDGEVLAYDSGRDETVPFGNNGTIARLRHKWMVRRGMCDDRDFGMHADDKEIKSVGPSALNKAKPGEFDEIAGEECWLVFYAFDIVYLDGPGAKQVLDTVVSSCIQPRPSPGSLIQLDGMERKKLLYAIVDVQDHEVEIVETMIVRPNGKINPGSAYFSWKDPVMECGHPAHFLDSIECNLAGAIPRIAEIDSKRRRGRSDEEISEARAKAIERIYKRTVEDQRLEGLLFKDLAAPYCLGATSKSLRYWLKFKPDYFNGSAASDVDLVICGAYFATGLRQAGKPSSFLCACVDSEDDQLFFPVCKVSAGSIDETTKATLYSLTGFRHQHGENHASVEYGKWFRGSSSSSEKDRPIPDFVSSRSYQSGGGSENSGWRCVKQHYPDLWIRPEDSVVVTINAGEIVVSESFSAGLTLRFPRITKLRTGADEKPLQDIENDRSLWAIFQHVTESRGGASDTTMESSSSPMKKGHPPEQQQSNCRFLTEQQFQASTKAKQSASKKRRYGIPMPPKVEKLDSRALQGLEFTVLDGNYFLEEKSIDEEQAKKEGWMEAARKVKNSMSIKYYIKRNGGVVKVAIQKHDLSTIVVGGREEDARVQNYKAAINAAIIRADDLGRTKKAIDNAALAKHKGVVRWTYVFSMVHRWVISHGKGTAILESNPTFFEPRSFDYLACPMNRTGYQVYADAEISDVISMRRALDHVGQDQSMEEEGNDNDDVGNEGSESSLRKGQSWRTIVTESLPPEHRWIVSCARQQFWPNEKKSNKMLDGVLEEVTIYPDIFHERAEEHNSAFALNYLLAGDDFVPDSELRPDNNNEIDAILSVLPLARIMGANITKTLDDTRVTHVLAQFLQTTTSKLQSVEVVDLDTLQTDKNLARAVGEEVVERLSSTIRNRTGAFAGRNRKPIVFVSPAWIRNLWQVN